MSDLNKLKSFDFTNVILPTFDETISNRPWVLFGGDNLWPTHSVELYNWSATNRAAINAKRDAVIGKKLLVDGVDTIMMVNSHESLYDVFKKVAMDMVIHNGFSMNVIKRRDGQGISDFYHMDFSKLRSGKVNEYDFVKHYWYSSDWAFISKYKPRELPAFDLHDPDLEPSQVYYYKTYQPTQTYYPINDWIGGRMAVEIDVSIMNYHLNNLKNHYSPSMFISLNQGVGSEEEREQIFRHFEAAYSSTNQAGKLILNFADSKENEPTIVPINNNNSDTFYTQMNEIVLQKILTAHRISIPEILGIKTPGQLGTKDQIIEGYEHFLQTVVIPVQEKLLKEFEKILFLRDGIRRELTIVQNEIFPDKETDIEVEGGL
jgi:hypothetical protein